MVVDRVEQGQECISYLREQNVGRASFLVLDKLPSPKDMRPHSVPTPENVPRLYDLVEPVDEKFRVAFWKAIGNTLVAKNLDEANRIAYGEKRWRVVTLEGQLIDSSGTMSGGGGTPSRGAMSATFATQAVSRDALNRLEQQMNDNAKKLNEAFAMEKNSADNLDQLKRRQPELDKEHKRLQMEADNAGRKIKDAEKLLNELM
jgi:structural maintenance of chromosome 4